MKTHLYPLGVFVGILFGLSAFVLPNVQADTTLSGNYFISGALRVGGSSNDTGDGTNIVLGANSIGTAHESMVLGANGKSTGSSSIAVGASANITGNDSDTLGTIATVSGNDSVAIGYNSNVTVNNAGAFGFNANVTGYEAMAIGTYANANQAMSLALGQGATTGSVAGGTNSMAIGVSAVANGNWSMSFGYHATTTGNDTVALGEFTTASSFVSLAVGTYNIAQTGQNSTAWVPTDDLFVIGNGNGTVASNALMVAKNGNMGIGNFSASTTGPSEILEVGGRLRLDSITLGNTSSNGTVAWNGTDLQLYKSGAWISLTSGAALSGGNLSLAANGTAAIPTINFGGGNNTGVFSPTTNVVSLATNGTERLRVDSGGNIGIGTGGATLSNTLTANGTINFNTTGGSATFAINSSGNVTVGGNITYTKRQGDIVMGAFGNGGGD